MAAGRPEAQEVRTQIARTLGLQRKFADAHALLDTVEAKLAALPAHVRVRYLLERGRTLNSSGAPQRAVPLFAEALTLAERDEDEFYAVDAAHMLGIAAPAAERLVWNLKALALAEAATDPRARGWRASLYNNIGWTYFDAGDCEDGARLLAEGARRARGDGQRRVDTRREMDGRARLPRASADSTTPRRRRRASLAEFEKIGETDGYVYEELAEIALARGDAKAARPWAAKAHAALKDDPGLAANEAARLARLAAVANGESPDKAKP